MWCARAVAATCEDEQALQLAKGSTNMLGAMIYLSLQNCGIFPRPLSAPLACVTLLAQVTRSVRDPSMFPPSSQAFSPSDFSLKVTKP